MSVTIPSEVQQLIDNKEGVRIRIDIHRGNGLLVPAMTDPARVARDAVKWLYKSSDILNNYTFFGIVKINSTRMLLVNAYNGDCDNAAYYRRRLPDRPTILINVPLRQNMSVSVASDQEHNSTSYVLNHLNGRVLRPETGYPLMDNLNAYHEMFPKLAQALLEYRVTALVRQLMPTLDTLFPSEPPAPPPSPSLPPSDT